MGLKHRVSWLTVLFSCFFFAGGLPTSLVEEVKDNEVRNVKVKRAHDELKTSAESLREPTLYLNRPTAIKRGTNFKLEGDQLGSWEQDPNLFQNVDVPGAAAIYGSDGDQFDDKSYGDFEKGFRYNANKEKLDEALENAVLKSELYREPSSINQFRYYGGRGEDVARKRRDAKKIRYDDPRDKREADLSPEDVLTILSLWEAERQRPSGYQTWQSFDPGLDSNKDNRDEDPSDAYDERWLDSPVYPHASQSSPAKYYYDKPQVFAGGKYGENKKRFMVTRKRNDPTRELRLLNGPNVNDYYTLTQIMANQRDPTIPLYHRRVL